MTLVASRASSTRASISLRRMMDCRVNPRRCGGSPGNDEGATQQSFTQLRRRNFIALLAGVAVWPLPLRAQHGKVYRLGILETIAAPLNAANLNALYKGLRAHGYVEGQNLAVEYRSADGKAERFSELAADLVSRNVDVIVTRGTPAAIAAKNAPGNIPVVMAAIGEPLGVGVVAELARPGGKVTGLSAFVTELAGKRVELLREMMPRLRRFGLVNNMGNPVIPAQWEETKKAAQLLRLEPRLFDVRSEDDIVRAFAAAKQEGVEAIVVGIDGIIQANRHRIIELAATHKLPAMYSSREFMDDGGLIAYGVSYPDLYFRSAGLIDKILKGARPADLPVEQPTKFETVVNLKVAKAIGLTIPESLLFRANEVIE
jgi:putative tryptophan/tyrosine transport system substrate-binding protein